MLFFIKTTHGNGMSNNLIQLLFTMKMSKNYNSA